jgi:hypothetical protein
VSIIVIHDTYSSYASAAASLGTGRCLKPNSNTVFLTYLYTTYVSFIGVDTGVGVIGASLATVSEVFDPALFTPICPASDGVYNFLKGLIGSAIGGENLAQFGPLIAGVLLRVRLELCVFESFLVGIQASLECICSIIVSNSVIHMSSRASW